MAKTRHVRGVTLTELVVASVLVGVGVFAAVKVFRGISQSVFLSQTKQVATTLAREKLEAMQVLPYYRLRAQAAPTYYQPGGSGAPYFYYDPFYSPGPEQIKVGTVIYRRGAYVERVYRDPATGNLVAMAANTPYQTEAGLKRIRSSVMWKDGPVWRVVDVTGLKENPYRTRGEVRFVGTITSTMGVPLSGAMGIRVDTVENLGQMVTVQPNAAGYYEFSIRPGTYTIRVRDIATNWLYYTAKKSAYVGYEMGVTTVNFQLSQLNYGRVDATFWWNPNPVISRVMGSSVSFSNPAFNQEWVEIFNPTTWTWDATKLNLHYYMNHNSSEPAPGGLINTTAELRKHRIDVNYINTTIPPGGYFLFANAPTIDLAEGSVAADAVWETVDPSSNAWWRVDRPAGQVGRFDPAGLLTGGQPNPDILTTAVTGDYLPSQTAVVPLTGLPAPKFNGGGGYLRLTYSQFSSTDQIYLDGVGWRGGMDGGTCAGGGRDPVDADGGFAGKLVDRIGVNTEDCEGLQAGEQYLRYASTMAWLETRDVGPAYDSNYSYRDWSRWDPAAPGYFSRFLPRNSLSAPVPLAAGRDTWVRTSDRTASNNEAGYVNAYVNDGIAAFNTVGNPTYYTGWTPNSTGYCTTCPKTNMYYYSTNGIPWWGRYQFLRVTTGTWTLGAYVRRVTGGSSSGGTPGQQPYEYYASTQSLVDVAPGSYEWQQALVYNTTDTIFLFGTVRDAYDVPIEDLRVNYKIGSATTPALAFSRSRTGGAYNIEYSSTTSFVNSGVHLNDPSTGDYIPTVVDAYWGPHRFFGGEGYHVNTCACPDTRLGYTGFLSGYVVDELGQHIPGVVVSAINAATKEERASGVTLTAPSGGRPIGYFRINVSTGDYQIKVMTEREETVTPALSAIVNVSTMLATSGGIVVGTFTITNAYGNRSGSVAVSSQAVQTGVLMVLTTATVVGSTPSAVTAQFRAGNVQYYMASSDAAGRYTFDVKMGTYNLYGFFPYFDAGDNLQWVKRSMSVFINSGNNATDIPTMDLTP